MVERSRSWAAGTIPVAVGMALSLSGCGWQKGAAGHDLETRIGRVEDGFCTGSLAKRMEASKVPGVSIAVVDDFEVEWARGHGVADVDAGDPVTPETLFLASSISKAVSAALALNLVEKGVLDLDEAVNRRLTSWQVPGNAYTAREDVTLRRLLGHSACVNRPAGGFSYEGEYPSTSQVLSGERPATNLPAAIECVPGSEVRYSNFGYVIVQQLVEDVTGRPFAEVAREIVLEPAGMSSSTFLHPLAGDQARRAAAPHNSDGRPRARGFNPHAVAQGGLWTTPSDLARFLIEIMRSRSGGSNRVLSLEMTRTMLTAHSRGLEGGGIWGLGFVVFGDWGVLTAGADPGFRCLLAGFPGQGKGIVVMLNGEEGEILQLRVLLNYVAEYLVWPHGGPVITGVLSLLTLASALVLWPAGWLLRLVRRSRSAARPDPETRRYARRARLLGAVVAILILGPLYPYLVHSFDPQGPPLWSGGGALVKGLVGVSMLSSLLSLVLAFLAVDAWKRRLWGPVGRAHFSLVAAAALCGSLLWLVVLGVA